MMNLVDGIIAMPNTISQYFFNWLYWWWKTYIILHCDNRLTGIHNVTYMYTELEPYFLGCAYARLYVVGICFRSTFTKKALSTSRTD